MLDYQHFREQATSTTSQHSTNYSLTEITEKIKQGCDSEKFVCGVFLEFQKTQTH